MRSPLTGLDEAVTAARALVPGAGRRLLGLAGPPGAGKSTLAAALADALTPAAVVVPMDGFHLPADLLAARGLADVKGAAETFDRAGLVELLARLRTGEPVRAPLFDRAAEATLPDALDVPSGARLVVVEGNYLLHWPDVRRLLDVVWFVAASSQERRVEALVARHVAFGRTPADALDWVLRSDEANARLIEASRAGADRQVTLW